MNRVAQSHILAAISVVARRLVLASALGLVAVLNVRAAGTARAADAPNDAVAKDPAIAYLLNAVETSTLTFVRDGRRYDGRATAAHMREKADHARRKIHAPEDFIRLAGTKSTLTGRPYFIEIAPGDRRRCDSWLRARLGDFRRKTGTLPR